MSWGERIVAAIMCTGIALVVGLVVYYIITAPAAQYNSDVQRCSSRWPSFETKVVDTGGFYNQCLVNIKGDFYPEEHIKVGN